MPSFQKHPPSCTCRSCAANNTPTKKSSFREFNKLYRKTKIPQGDKQLIKDLVKTRVIYEDIRNQLLLSNPVDSLTLQKSTSYEKFKSRSDVVLKIINLVDKGDFPQLKTRVNLHDSCCQCCICQPEVGIPKKYRVQMHPSAQQKLVDYNNKLDHSRRKLSKAVKIGISRSEPCVCTLKFKDFVQQHIPSKEEFYQKLHLRSSASRKQQSISIEVKPSKSKETKPKEEKSNAKCECSLGPEPEPEPERKSESERKSEREAERESEQQKRKEFRESISKMTNAIKDSILYHKKNLKRKKSLKAWTCETDTCIPDECDPEDCFRKIKARQHSRRSFTTSSEKISKRKGLETRSLPKKPSAIGRRCFCTLQLKKLPKRRSRQVSTPSAKTKSKSIADDSRKTSAAQVKTKAAQCDCIVSECECFVSKTSQTDLPQEQQPSYISRKSQPRMELLPYECEPSFCVPGKCDPIICEERIKTRGKASNRRHTLQLQKSKTKSKSITVYNRNPSSAQVNIKSAQCECFVSQTSQTDVPQEKQPSFVSQKSQSNELLPYECEPSFCVPGKCDPIICEERIKTREKTSNRRYTLQLQKLPKTKRSSRAVRTAHRSSQTISPKTSTAFSNSQTNMNLEPHECEPYTCIPGECDPIVCEKRIKLRNHKNRRRNKFTESMHKSKPEKSSSIIKKSSLTSRTSHNLDQRKKRHSKGSNPKKSKSAPHSMAKRGVKVKSSFSFEIEFYRNKNPEDIGDHNLSQKNTKTKLDKRKHVKSLQTETYSKTSTRPSRSKSIMTTLEDSKSVFYRTSSNQTGKVKYRNKSTDSENALKRCFCTLQFHTKPRSRSSGTSFETVFSKSTKTMTPPVKVKDSKLLADCLCRQSLSTQTRNNDKSRGSQTSFKLPTSSRNMKEKKNAQTSVSTSKKTKATSSKIKTPKKRTSHKQITKPSKVYYEPPPQPSYKSSGVKVESTVSFNIDFYKRQTPFRQENVNVYYVTQMYTDVRPPLTNTNNIKNVTTAKKDIKEKHIEPKLKYSFSKTCYDVSPVKSASSPNVNKRKHVVEIQSCVSFSIGFSKVKRRSKPRVKIIPQPTVKKTKNITDITQVDKKVIKTKTKSKATKTKNPVKTTAVDCSCYEVPKTSSVQTVKNPSKVIQTTSKKTHKEIKRVKDTSTSIKVVDKTKITSPMISHTITATQTLPEPKIIKEEVMSPKQPSGATRQTVKISSKFSINIEFIKTDLGTPPTEGPITNLTKDSPREYKDTTTIFKSEKFIRKEIGTKMDIQPVVATKKTMTKPVQLAECECYEVNKISSTQTEKPISHKSQANLDDLSIKNQRCFCTLQLNIKPKKVQNTETVPKPIKHVDCQCYETTATQIGNEYETSIVKTKKNIKSKSLYNKIVTKPSTPNQAQYKRRYSRKTETKSKPDKSQSAPDAPMKRTVRITSNFGFDIQFTKGSKNNSSLRNELVKPKIENDTPTPIANQTENKKSKKKTRDEVIRKKSEEMVEYRKVKTSKKVRTYTKPERSISVQTKIKNNKPEIDKQTSDLLHNEEQKKKAKKRNNFVIKCLCSLSSNYNSISKKQMHSASNQLSSTRSIGTKTKSDPIKYITLLPYECSPGVCIPGKCNPYKCYELIKKRNMTNLHNPLTYII